MIDYILTLIVSFLGVFLGGILALISPEELKPGKKYFKIVGWAVLIALLALSLYFSQIIWFILIAVLILFLKVFNREYPALAFVLFFSFFADFLFIAASMIFIYGLPLGTLQASEKIKGKITRKKIKHLISFIAKNNIAYIIFGLILSILIFFI